MCCVGLVKNPILPSRFCVFGPWVLRLAAVMAFDDIWSRKTQIWPQHLIHLTQMRARIVLQNRVYERNTSFKQNWGWQKFVLIKLRKILSNWCHQTSDLGKLVFKSVLFKESNVLLKPLLHNQIRTRSNLRLLETNLMLELSVKFTKDIFVWPHNQVWPQLPHNTLKRSHLIKARMK